MEDIHDIFTKFKEDFPRVHSVHEALAKKFIKILAHSQYKIRWLIKIAISGASHHPIALETHIMKAKEAGVADDEIKHALLLLIQTTGFPALWKPTPYLEKTEIA